MVERPGSGVVVGGASQEVADEIAAGLGPYVVDCALFQGFVIEDARVLRVVHLQPEGGETCRVLPVPLVREKVPPLLEVDEYLLVRNLSAHFARQPVQELRGILMRTDDEIPRLDLAAAPVVSVATKALFAADVHVSPIPDNASG